MRDPMSRHIGGQVRLSNSDAAPSYRIHYAYSSNVAELERSVGLELNAAYVPEHLYLAAYPLAWDFWLGEIPVDSVVYSIVATATSGALLFELTIERSIGQDDHLSVTWCDLPGRVAGSWDGSVEWAERSNSPLRLSASGAPVGLLSLLSLWHPLERGNALLPVCGRPWGSDVDPCVP